jgi:hypothetical protein
MPVNASTSAMPVPTTYRINLDSASRISPRSSDISVSSSATPIRGSC